MIIRSNPLITVSQTRRLLGDDAGGMTDEQVQDLIDDLDIMAQYVIKMVQRFKENIEDTEVS